MCVCYVLLCLRAYRILTNSVSTFFYATLSCAHKHAKKHSSAYHCLCAPVCVSCSCAAVIIYSIHTRQRAAACTQTSTYKPRGNSNANRKQQQQKHATTKTPHTLRHESSRLWLHQTLHPNAGAATFPQYRLLVAPGAFGLLFVWVH